MPRYNTQFELSLDDMDVIETALRSAKTRLSVDAIEGETQEGEAVSQMRQIHELLGRLHNQKQFFRPKTGAYISG